MYFSADETLEALYDTERVRRQPPIQSSNGKSLLTGVVIGIILGKRLGR